MSGKPCGCPRVTLKSCCPPTASIHPPYVPSDGIVEWVPAQEPSVRDPPAQEPSAEAPSAHDPPAIVKEGSTAQESEVAKGVSPSADSPSADSPSADSPSADSPSAQPKSPKTLEPLRQRLRADAPRFPENFNPGIKALCVERDGQKMLVYHAETGVLDFDTLKHELESRLEEEIDAGITTITEHRVLTMCAICARISYCDVDYDGDAEDICVGCWIVERSENGLGHIPTEKLKGISGLIHDLYYELY